jgi:hypothetical protein
MNKTTPLLFLFLGCQQPIEYIEIRLPEMEMSSTSIDFGTIQWGTSSTKSLYIENQGDLPMGLHTLKIEEEGFEINFSVTYNPNNIECPEEPSENDIDEEIEYHLGAQDTILNPGCRVSADITYTPIIMGEAYAAVTIESFIEPEEFDEETIPSPRFYRDPSNFKQTILLHGYSNLGEGNIVVTPRIVDFGHHWTGESVTRQIMINNVGDGSLLIENPYISESCDEAFELDINPLDPDRIIPAGEGTIFEATFTPVDLETAFCTVFIPSNDAETDLLEVSLKGNVGVDPTNMPPSVTMISPSIGYRHDGIEPVVFEMSIYDPDQPANTLICKIKSMHLLSGTYDCSPDDESGFVRLEIPIQDLDRGVDTFLVTVTDQSEQQGFASTTILVGAAPSEIDIDLDGYGPDGDVFDCDESDPSVYPYAAEIADGKDNDCDGAIDEKTDAADDDGDSISELDGDCNDNDITTYPGAPELPDQRDNDCDGAIDETTSLYDDDGDGFSEVDNDCNDSDPNINPSAIEYCDNIDNNCNTLRDEQEGCVSLDTEPFIIGGIQMSVRAISVGETATMTVFVYEADGSDISFSWEEDSNMNLLGHTAISTPTAQTITWTAPPELPGSSDGEIFSVYVLVTDAEGNQDWVFDEISVYSDPVEQSITEVTSPNTGGCSGSSALTLLFLPLFGYRRSRKQQ